MNLPTYLLKAGENAFTYGFVSGGPKGFTAKRVQFSLVYADNVYNLSFGDVNAETQKIDDQIASNNGDLELVLATVAAAAYDFCRHHPDASLYLTGSTPARTRLYQIGITRFLDLIQSQFSIYGELGDSWEPFQRNKRYTAFFIQPTSSFDSYL